MGMRGQPNPLFKPIALRRTAGVVLTGLTLALLSAPNALAADPLVVDTSLAVVKAQPGQSIQVKPQTMDLKLREAVLVAMPLAFGAANDAVQRFDQQSPIPVGTAEVGTKTFGGSDIAAAAVSRLDQLGLPADKVDDVQKSFQSLVGLANSVTVIVPQPAQPAPPPPSSKPSPPPSSQQPAPSPQPSPGGGSQAGQAPAAQPAPSQSSEPLFMPSASSAPHAMSVLPPSLRTASELPWANTSYGAVPGSAPSIGDLTKQDQQRQQEQARQEEIRAAGSASSLPAETSQKVALPVLLAAISLSVVTAALVRAWVLRRQ